MWAEYGERRTHCTLRRVRLAARTKIKRFPSNAHLQWWLTARAPDAPFSYTVTSTAERGVDGLRNLVNVRRVVDAFTIDEQRRCTLHGHFVAQIQIGLHS